MSLIEYQTPLIRLPDVCLVTKVRLYTIIRLCQLLFVHGYRGYTLFVSVSKPYCTVKRNQTKGIQWPSTDR